MHATISSVARELSQLGVTRVELPELQTQLNSVERVATESTTVVTAFGSPLPYLVRSHTKPNNSVSQIVLPRLGSARLRLSFTWLAAILAPAQKPQPFPRLNLAQLGSEAAKPRLHEKVAIFGN